MSSCQTVTNGCPIVVIFISASYTWMNREKEINTMKTKEELNALKKDVECLNKKLMELSQEELEQVAGGDIFDDFLQWVSSNFGYKSGTTPKFSNGQEVRFYDGYIWRDGEIVDVDSRNAGIINTEFSYTVRCIVTANTYTGIYESNIQER